jgi:hypothetical protein
MVAWNPSNFQAFQQGAIPANMQLITPFFTAVHVPMFNDNKENKYSKSKLLCFGRPSWYTFGMQTSLALHFRLMQSILPLVNVYEQF